MAYGTTEGNLGNMKEGLLGAITSPPFADIVPFQDQGFAKHGGPLSNALYGDSPGQIGNLSSITSPPFSEPGTQDRHSVKAGNVRDAMKRSYTADHQASDPANIALSSITSPPFSPDGMQPGTKQDTRANLKAQGEVPEGSYGETEGQIGQHAITNDEKDTYWQACSQVYASLYQALTPGSIVCMVVKGFIRKKVYVDLPQMTLDLLLHLGYEPVLWVDAMVIARDSQASMLDEVPEYRKKRVSFFRRLAEKNGAPEINSEVVLVVRRP